MRTKVTVFEADGFTPRTMIRAFDGSCHTYERTNDRLERVKQEISFLIDWAHSDAQHARENDAPNTAKDDMRRARTLQKALELLDECKR